ncbi:MAG: DUF1624 domain-containing protein [Bacteroidales bacterium]|nr:DUF1624 domain-containing protein [Bacteroidales bacterium]
MAQKKRLVSLDVLRGITVAGMILVNNSGGDFTYEPLKHSVWNGMTPCDLVFPFFLFIMGISTYISLNKFNFKLSKDVVLKVLKRTLIMLCIGWGINWFAHLCNGDFFPFATLRLTGVMTRIALCYGVVSLMALLINHKHLIKLSILILAGYILILVLGNGYAYDESNLLGIIDRTLLGPQHLYQKSIIDPEGVTSTLAAIVHTLIGFYCGNIIMRTKEVDQKVLKLFLVGFILIMLGWLFSYALPLNKRIWSPTFLCVTCGSASSLLALLMYFIDVKKKDRWTRVFLVFGMNPLFLYVFSEILAIIFSASGINKIAYESIHVVIADPYIASVTYALLYTLLFGVLGYVLFQKKIYIKI